MANDPLGLFEEEKDPLGLFSEGSKEDPLGLFPKKEKSYLDRVVTEAAPAILNMGADIVNAIPSGVAGAGEAVGSLLMGKGLDQSMGQGLQRFSDTMEHMRKPGTIGMPRFRGEGVEAMEQAAGELGEQAIGWIGDIAEDPVPFQTMEDTPVEWLSPAARTIGEAASNFVPVPGAQALARAPRIGSIARKSAKVEAKKAEELLAKKDDEKKLDQEQAKLQIEINKYDEALRDYDNLMIGYPKDMQAPQLGLGGKVARHEDQVGKRQSGEFSNQMAWDEEMRLQAEQHQKYVNEQHEQALQPGVDHLDQYGPTYKGTTQDHAPAPVRPYQIEQTRPGTIGEGEATNIYRKPSFERTTEERLKLQEYEAMIESRRGTSQFDEAASDVPPRTEAPAVIRTNRGPEKAGTDYDLDFTKKTGGETGQDGWPRVESRNPMLANVQMRIPDQYKGIAGPEVRTQLAVISRTSKNPYYQKLAGHFLADPEFNPRFIVSEDTYIKNPLTNRSERFGGLYDPRKHEIRLNPKHVGREEHLLHEAFHAKALLITHYAEHNHPSVAHLKPTVDRLHQVFKSFKKDYYDNRLGAGKKDPYAFKNVHEFITEAMSNPTFQKLLKSVELPAHLQRPKSGIRTLWDSLVETFKDMLGLDRADTSYLSELLTIGAELSSQSTKGLRTAAVKGGLEAKYGAEYTFKDFKDELREKGIHISDKAARAMFAKHEAKAPKQPGHPKQAAMDVAKDAGYASKLQKQYVDTRPLETVVEEAMSMPDISFYSKNITRKIIQGGLTAGDHPVLSWVSSHVNQIKNSAVMLANQKLHGKSAKNPDPGSYNHVWKTLKSEERMEVNMVGQALNNEAAVLTDAAIQSKARELIGAELSPRQLAAYKDRIRINKEVLRDINKKLEEGGKPPIPELPNYWSPNVFEGPFIVKFIDKDGVTRKVESSYLKPNVAKLRAMPEAQGFRVEVVEKGLKKDMDFDQLDYILRQLHQEQRDAAAQAISAGLKRMGFMKHSLKREGVPGGLGTAPNKKGLREYERVSEEYIRKAYDYIGNRDLDDLFTKIKDNTDLDARENVKALSLESIDLARGGINPQFEALSTMLSEGFRGAIRLGSGGTVHLPQRALRDLLKHSNRVMTNLLLGFYHPIHITAQLLQAPMYMPPKLLAMAAQNGNGMVGTPAMAMRAFAKGMAEYTKWNDSVDVKKLQEIGALDATFRHDFSTYADPGDLSLHQKKLRGYVTGMNLLGDLESNAVRRPAALMFVQMLRELGYDKIAKTPDEIYHVARELTDDYMVSTKYHKKPHVFSRSGIVGTALSPLQSFTTTWIGMLREYSKLSAQGALKGSVAESFPLAAFMGASLLTSGMVGALGIKEWDFLATKMNDWFGYNLPTGTEFVLSKFKSDKVRFGLLSDAVGMHIGAVFGSPSLMGTGAAGLQLLGKGAGALATLGKEATGAMGLTNPPTQQQRRDAMKGVAPRIGWGTIEKMNTPEGLPYQDTGGNAGPVTRTDADWLARHLATYSLEEVKEKNKAWTLKRKGAERTKRLSNNIEKVVDQMVSGGDWKTAFERALPQFQEDGYTGADIKMALKREIMAKMIESDEAMTKGGGSSSRKRYLARILKGLGE